MANIIFGAVLGIGSLQDIRRRQIGLYLIAAGAALAIIVNVNAHMDVSFFLPGIIPGVVMMLVSWLSKGKIGMGDALMVMVMGLFLGLYRVMYELVLALVMSGCVALILVIFKKKRKEYEMPFIPFLGLAYLVDIC